MISVETKRPVYSYANGGFQIPDGKGGFKDATEAEAKAYKKKQLRSKAWEKTKQVYGKAKESGLLQGLENLALQKSGSDSPDANTNLPDTNPAPTGMSKGLKIGLIAGGVAIVGFAIYWFAFRKKASTK